MAIHKARTSDDIVNGASTVLAGNKSYVYDPTDRTLHYASGDSLLTNRYADGKYLEQSPILPSVSGDTNAPTANVAAQVYYTAKEYRLHELRGVKWSYDGDPTNGTLTIQSPSGTTVFGPMQITTKGPGFFPFEKGLRGKLGNEILVTLSAGGSGVKGTLSVTGRREL